MANEIETIISYLKYILADTAFKLGFMDSESIKAAREEYKSLGDFLVYERVEQIMAREEYDLFIKEADGARLALYDNALFDLEAEKQATVIQISDSTKRMPQ